MRYYGLISCNSVTVNNIVVEEDMTVEGTATTANSLEVITDLTVLGTANIATEVVDNISINGTAWVNNLRVTGNVITVNSMEISGNLHASGNTVLGDIVGIDTLTVNGNSQFNGNVEVTGTINVATIDNSNGVSISSVGPEGASEVALTDEVSITAWGSERLKVQDNIYLNTTTVVTANATLDVATISHSGGTTFNTGVKVLSNLSANSISTNSVNVGLINMSGDSVSGNGGYIDTDDGGITLYGGSTFEGGSNYIWANPEYVELAWFDGADIYNTFRMTNNGLYVNCDSQFSGNVTISANKTLDVATISHNGGTEFITPLRAGYISDGGNNNVIRIDDNAVYIQNLNVGTTSVNSVALKNTAPDVLSVLSCNNTDYAILDVATISHNGGTTFNTEVKVENNVTCSTLYADEAYIPSVFDGSGHNYTRRYTSPNLTANTFYTVNHTLAVDYPQVIVISNNQVIIPHKISYNDNNNVVVDFSGNTVNCYVTVVG